MRWINNLLLIVLQIGLITCLYSKPDYTSKIAFKLPEMIKINHVETVIDSSRILWVHLKVTGIINIDGYVPIGRLE